MTDDHLPVIVLRQELLLPFELRTTSVGRGMSIAAVGRALERDRRIVCVTQHEKRTENPVSADLPSIGVVATILDRDEAQDTETVVLRAAERVRVVEFRRELDHSWTASIKTCPVVPAVAHASAELAATLVRLGGQLDPACPPHGDLSQADGRSRFAFELAAAAMRSAHGDHTAALRAVLLAQDEAELINAIAMLFENISATAALHKEVQTRVQERMASDQRENVLRQQLRYLTEQLGDVDDDVPEVVRQIREQLATSHMWPEEAARVAKERLSALENMPASTAEFQNIAARLRWLARVPWNKTAVASLEEAHVMRDLDEHHFGAQHVKDWVLEQVAVMRLTQTRPPPLCLVGPPRVGKTSLAQGIASALRRPVALIPLAGLNDASRVRGMSSHYVGAEPGQLIKAAVRVGTLAPVFVLDEIDRLKDDYRSDPAAALAQALDPAQLGEYRDDYLEVSVDLSRAMFIATATKETDIHPMLRSRMEILTIWGYGPAEKFEIARAHLCPAIIGRHGLSGRIAIDDGALRHIISRYTIEPGVRELAAAIAKICRRSAKQAAGRVDPILISKELLHSLLGPAPMSARAAHEPVPGEVVATSFGRLGAMVSHVRCLIMMGAGKLTLTGSNSESVKEELTVAISLLRARDIKTYDDRMFPQFDLHLHLDSELFGAGGAGAVMLIALASAIRKTAPRSETIAIGTIDLTGRVGGVDGLYPQVLAAQAAGIKEFILSELHREDVEQFPARMRSGSIKFWYVRDVDRMLELAGITLR